MGNKRDINNLIGNMKQPKATLRRGQGMMLSTEMPSAQEVPEEAAQPKVKRVNRGYQLREDLIKAYKRASVESGKPLYLLMEEALEQHLAQLQKSAES